MNEISSKDIYERINYVLETPFETLRDYYEFSKMERNLLVDWDKNRVDKAMKRIIKNNANYHIEYKYSHYCLSIRIYRKGYYRLTEWETNNAIH